VDDTPKTDDEIAESLMLALKFVHVLARKWRCSLEPEERQSAAHHALAMAMKRHDPTKGKFGAFLYFQAMAAIRYEVEFRKGKCADLPVEEAYGVAAAGDLYSRIEAKNRLAVLYRGLDAQDRIVMRGTLLDDSTEEVSKQAGCSETNVFYKRQRIASRLATPRIGRRTEDQPIAAQSLRQAKSSTKKKEQIQLFKCKRCRSAMMKKTKSLLCGRCHRILTGDPKL
jgi:hypothetical protein